MRYSLKQIIGEGRLWICNHLINKVPSHTIRLCFYRNIMKFKISKGSSIHLGCRFNCKNHFSLGTNSTINQRCHLDNRGGIFIGSNVSIGPNVNIVTADHNLKEENCFGREKKIIIHDYVFIGHSALILGETILEQGSAIGAMGVFVGKTESFGIYVGNPAKLKSMRPSNLNYKMNYRRIFH